MKSAVVRLRASPDGVVRTLVLDGPPANVVGISTCAEMLERLEVAMSDGRTRLIVVTGMGDHFSYGASIDDHVPERARGLLASFHAVIRALSSLPIPTLAAVRGRCLGGGFEVALACGMIIAEEGATFAAPEIELGVFAPAATALLDGRVPRAIQEDVLIAGRVLTAAEAVQWGLVNKLVAPGGLSAGVQQLADASIRPRSMLALRAATKAIRERPARILRRRLAALEQLYVTDLLSTEEGSEGIRAFLEKRAPKWEAS